MQYIAGSMQLSSSLYLLVIVVASFVECACPRFIQNTIKNGSLTANGHCCFQEPTSKFGVVKFTVHVGVVRTGPSSL